MKIHAVLAFVVFALVFAPAAFGVPISSPNQQPNLQQPAPSVTWGIVPMSQAYFQKFPGFAGAYNKSVSHTPVQSDRAQKQEGSQNSVVNLPPGDQYRQKVAAGSSPIRAEASGAILPDGRYSWDGRTGVVPNPTMQMPGAEVPFAAPDSGYAGPLNSVLNAIDPQHNRTTSITNMEFAAISAAQGELLNEIRSEPQRQRDYDHEAQEVKQSSQSNETAAGAEATSTAAWNYVALPLINVANESAWTPCNSEDAFKSYSNAAWMVGQMYKQVYIPIAILLMLPGAILTQTTTMVRCMYLQDPTGLDEELMTPWTGVFRSMVAIFLIPATQLFVSYTIDVGNALTWEVTQCPYWNVQRLQDWRNDQTYDPKFNNMANHIANVSESTSDDGSSGMQGKARDVLENQTVFENQNFLSSTQAQWFNTLSSILAQGMAALNAFQVVMIMYLFLLGPVAAGLFCWPGVGPSCFRRIYANWMDGVVLVTLWKFWWAVIMLAMMVRLDMQQAHLDMYTPDWNDQYEMYMFAAFCAILMYVPFNPFDFQPGQAVAACLDGAQSQLPKEGPQGYGTGAAHGGGMGSGPGLGGRSGGPTGAGSTE
jgi:hypothetical protein